MRQGCLQSSEANQVTATPHHVQPRIDSNSVHGTLGIAPHLNSTDKEIPIITRGMQDCGAAVISRQDDSTSTRQNRYPERHPYACDSSSLVSAMICRCTRRRFVLRLVEAASPVGSAARQRGTPIGKRPLITDAPIATSRMVSRVKPRPRPCG